MSWSGVDMRAGLWAAAVATLAVLLGLVGNLATGTVQLSTATNQHISSDTATHGLSCLYRLSLITHTPDTPHQAVRIHALVQRATRDTLTQLDTAVHAAADALIEAWPDLEHDTSLDTVLRANATTLINASSTLLWHPDTHPLLFRVGRSLGGTGQVNAAIDYHVQLEITTRQQLGSDHPSTLKTRHNLARWRGEAGDPANAVADFQGLLADSLRILGPDNPRTLATPSPAGTDGFEIRPKRQRPRRFQVRR